MSFAGVWSQCRGVGSGGDCSPGILNITSSVEELNAPSNSSSAVASPGCVEKELCVGVAGIATEGRLSNNVKDSWTTINLINLST